MQQVKKEFDPLDVFHHGLSIRLPGSDAERSAQAPAAQAGSGRIPRPVPKAYAKPAPLVHGVAHRIIDAQR